MKRILLPLFTAIALAGCVSTGKNAQKAGTEYLGADVLWRPREWIIFNMLNEQGKGFDLKFTVRDMNTYVHAPAPVFFFVISPDSKILIRQFLEDDGITGGNFKQQDGIYDPYADFRYRQWHRANSPNGIPPHKTRSPYLEHPEKLPTRTVSLNVPAAGKGIYRVVVVGRWDHWISVDSSLPMPTGINPGAGPLYVHGANLDKSFFYVPAASKEIGLMTTEEVQPYNAQMTVKNLQGKVLKHVKASGFATYMTLTPEKKDTVYELDLKAENTGVCLHGAGFPFVICPDAATASKLHGGMQVDAQGRITYHKCSRELDAWLDSLKPEDLKVGVKLNDQQRKLVLTGETGIAKYKVTLGQIETLIKNQNIDPKSKDYGKITGKVGWFDTTELLALAAGAKIKGNVYYGNPALIRRVLLASIKNIRILTPELRFEGAPVPWTAKPVTHYFYLPGRSNWYGLGLDGQHALSLELMKDVTVKGLPQNVVEAWKDACRIWAAGRANMHVGEVANQWGWNYMIMKGIYLATGDPEIKAMLIRHGKLVSKPDLYGRINPDETPFDHKIGRLDTDCGGTRSGYMPEQLGFDGEYSCEQTMLWGSVWKLTKSPAIVKWFNRFNILKTHLTLPRDGSKPKFCFSETSSPTDLNFRTRYMTMKNHQPEELVGQIEYLDLWFPPKDQSAVKPWPCMESGSFSRVIDNKFYFIKQGDYYAILYGGPRLPLWANWSEANIIGNSLNFDGPAGPSYGGWGRSANKPGGISALWVKDCGIVSLGQNHSIMDSNTIWGHALKPLFKKWNQDVDPTEFAACFGQPDVEFDPVAKVYQITEMIPNVPLVVRRRMEFKQNHIDVKVEIEALEQFECRDLNYSIPFYADKRTLTGFCKENKFAIAVPKALDTPTRPPHPTPELEKKRYTNKCFVADGFSITAANGAGAVYRFNKEFTVKLLTPIRYRPQQCSAGTLMLELPIRWKAHKKFDVSYTINLTR